MIEFAVLLPVYLLLLAGVFGFSDISLSRQALVQVTRYAMWTGDSPGAKNLKTAFLKPFSGELELVVEESQPKLSAAPFNVRGADPSAQPAASQLVQSLLANELDGHQGNQERPLKRRTVRATFTYKGIIPGGRAMEQALALPNAGMIYLWNEKHVRPEHEEGSQDHFVARLGNAAFDPTSEDHQYLSPRVGPSFLTSMNQDPGIWSTQARIGGNIGTEWSFYQAQIIAKKVVASASSGAGEAAGEAGQAAEGPLAEATQFAEDMAAIPAGALTELQESLDSVMENLGPITEAAAQLEELTNQLDEAQGLLEDSIGDLTGPLGEALQDLAQQAGVPDTFDVGGMIEQQVQDQIQNQVNQVKQQLTQQLDQVTQAIQNPLNQAKQAIDQVKSLGDLTQKLEDFQDQLPQLKEAAQQLEQLKNVTSQLDKLQDLKDQVSSLQDLTSQAGELSQLGDKLGNLGDLASKLPQLESLADKLTQVQNLSELGDVAALLDNLDNPLSNLQDLEKLVQDAGGLKETLQDLQSGKLFEELNTLKDVTDKLGDLGKLAQDMQDLKNMGQQLADVKGTLNELVDLKLVDQLKNFDLDQLEQMTATQLKEMGLPDVAKLKALQNGGVEQLLESSPYKDLAPKELQQAISSLQKTLSTNPNDAGALLQKGLAELVLPDGLDAARQSIIKAVQLDPGNLHAQTALGDILQLDGNLQGAVDAYSKAVSANPYNPAGWLKKGLVELESGLADSAFDSLKAATELNPRSWEAWSGLGQVLEKTHLDDALDSYSTALAINPEDAVTRVRRALINSSVGELGSAVQDLNQALKAAPSDPFVLGGAGDILSSAGKLDRAVEYYTRALNLEKITTGEYNPFTIAKRAVAQSELANGDPTIIQKASREAERALRLDPENPQLLTHTAKILAKLDDTAGALERLNQALNSQSLASDHQTADTWAARARIYLGGDGEENQRQAVDDFNQALSLNSKSYQAWSGLAEAQEKLGDLEATLEAANRALALNPNDPTALLLRAKHSPDKVQAVADAKRVIQLAEHDVRAEALRSQAQSLLSQE